MATGLNTYAALHNNEMYDEVLRCDAGFTFVDFLPRTVVSGGFFRSPVFENFRTLIDRANEFLRSNRKWKIVTCESVEFNSRGDKVDPFKMTYLEYGETYTSYIRGLRLWLTQRKDEKEREQQIGYFNLIPQQLEEGGIFRSPKFENLDMVIRRFNSQLYSNPLPGRIITIESQEMKISSFSKFDPDRSNWSEGGNAIKSFIFVIRIFYEIMEGRSEEIGITDFIPANTSEGGIFSLPEYERFSNVVNRASSWCAQQRDIRFCNAQTLEIKVKRAKDVDPERMYYTESGSMTTYYVRVLRVAYTKPLSDHYSVSEKPSPISELTCRTFVPVQLSTGIFVPDYENLAVTRERISAWVKATGVRVLSAETTAYRIMSGNERTQGSEASFSYSTGKRNEYWMFVIRLYLDGLYKEPPPEMLPALPAMEKNFCHIS